MSRSLYRDGETYVLVETGMPEDTVRVGVGDTIAEAIDGLQDTALQSTGRDSGEAAALRWAHSEGWISDPDDLEGADDELEDLDAEVQS